MRLASAFCLYRPPTSQTEYEIFYTIKYSVTAEGKELLTTQTLTLTRDYSFDETTLLAKEHEEDILREALARD